MSDEHDDDFRDICPGTLWGILDADSRIYRVHDSHGHRTNIEVIKLGDLHWLTRTGYPGDESYAIQSCDRSATLVPTDDDDDAALAAEALAEAERDGTIPLEQAKRELGL